MSGNWPGFSMTKRLFRLVLPDNSWTFEAGTAKVFARNFCNCLLALPSTGGAQTRILILPSCRPTISSLLARGWR